ncbi:MAG TPA: YihY/virulence factor BrkB family protein [Acidobacteriaceae bacterium]|nr:YihY/virulence factor BrkB family protein [Acidobacteriaceae bacterium]
MLSISPKRDLLEQESTTQKSSDAREAVPIEQVRPVVCEGGLGAQMLALAKYMVRTEVHTYAFSVAANVILSLFPFIVMLLTISRQVFHSQAMVGVVREMMISFLPSNQDFIMRNMVLLATPHKSTQIYSVIMLLVSSTGVFLPLEVALNGVWGVKENRSYVGNQLLSLGLALLIGTLAMASVGFTTAQGWIFVGHTGRFASVMLKGGTATILGMTSSVLIFFLIYWILPNRKVPARAVLPTAIVIGLLWEGAKILYVWTLPHLDFKAVYGPFEVSVGLMIWAFLSGLLLLAGAHFSATRYALRTAREDEAESNAESKELNAAG